MIRIHQIKLKTGQSEAYLRTKAAGILNINENAILKLGIVKRSLDARKKPELFYSYIVDIEAKDEEKIVKRCKNAARYKVMCIREIPYRFPFHQSAKPITYPVIVGMGPAGLFCGYFLALAGFEPLLLERGKDVDERQKDVETFWETGLLNPDSNVQFGEGGAGTFSDGKLNTLVKDKYGRNKEVLQILVRFGAPKDILYDNKPHIGTDILRQVVKNMRMEIQRLGGKVCFQSEVTDLLLENGRVKGVVVNGSNTIHTDAVVLAIGHSARNTFEMLFKRNIPMEAKPFAVGLRVEHSQKMIDESQYGTTDRKSLPAASYKVAAKTKDGRGVYSFCMCPGGYVVNASSEPGRLCVNGMSYSGRDGKNANSAIIVTVTPKDYGLDHPLAGMAFQRELEAKAFRAGNGKVPVQTYLSFQKSVLEKEGVSPSEGAGFAPAIKGAYVFTDITGILPQNLNRGIVEGMEQFAKEIRGFNRPDTLLLGVEARTSSPVRILRDESMQSSLEGLYPCGEGAGYAGGITSAAMDGIRVAEAVASGRGDNRN